METTRSCQLLLAPFVFKCHFTYPKTQVDTELSKPGIEKFSMQTERFLFQCTIASMWSRSAFSCINCKLSSLLMSLLGHLFIVLVHSMCVQEAKRNAYQSKRGKKRAHAHRWLASSTSPIHVTEQCTRSLSHSPVLNVVLISKERIAHHSERLERQKWRQFCMQQFSNKFLFVVIIFYRCNMKLNHA